MRSVAREKDGEREALEAVRKELDWCILRELWRVGYPLEVAEGTLPLVRAHVLHRVRTENLDVGVEPGGRRMARAFIAGLDREYRRRRRLLLAHLRRAKRRGDRAISKRRPRKGWQGGG